MQGVVEVALSGNLGFVPLNEVLRLLARAGQKGAIEVRGDSVRGRIFVTPRGIALATTSTDAELRSHLINSEFVDDGFLGSVESGAANLEPAAEKDPDLLNLLREMTVESIYQMTSNGISFEVDEHAESPYSSPKPFELESILDDVRRRDEEWAEVSEILSDMAGVIRMRRDLGNRDEVTISRDAWKLLSELGAGSSVGEIARRLGTTDFWTARVAAEMAGRELLNLGERLAAELTPPAETLETEEAVDASVAQVEEPAASAESTDPNQSWWVEPEHEAKDDDATAEGDAEGDAEVDAGKGGRLGVFALNRDNEPGAAPTFESERHFDDVEEDTEAFLEKVFSELQQPEPEAESEPEPQPQPEDEGHGLLRRRRLGSLLQESQAKED